ncbi:hypothetical protein MNBD_GAMMA11-1380 [hydrothermal vent metagenome]|uniref:Uncharacterized protein n=1 Tax=hydrothermal vent metagenome TaxID=652676 RepID=A0A3B0YC97_9ZZZZ
MFEQWPWWFSAITLAVLGLGFILTTHRILSGSGNWARVIEHDSQEDIAQAEGPFRKNPAMLNDALMKATLEEFGYKVVVDFLARRKGDKIPEEQPKAIVFAERTSWTVHLTFLLMLIVGGLIASLTNGSFEFRASFGELHTSLFGGGMGYWITLIMGGFMVGFGTQMAGGCSFGHGLGGCSRFVPASLIATGTFFMTAIITSVFIHYIITGSFQ